MDLRLKSVLAHPRSGVGHTDYAFSTRYPRLVSGAQDLLIDFNTTNSSIRSSIRTSAKIEKLVYVGSSGCFLVFLENDTVLSYSETPSNLILTYERRLGGAGRSISLACGSQYGRVALFSKVDSPSVWCILVSDDGTLANPFKLRSDIEGDQDNVNLISGTFAKVRGKVATKNKSKPCPVAAINTHATLPYVTAAYINGIIRIWDISKKQQRNHFDSQLMMREKIVDIAMHPKMSIVAVCTSLGRVLSFHIKNGLYKRGDEPDLAGSKVRDRKRNYRVMCFTNNEPSYLLLLTATQRIVVKMINNSGIISSSTRYQKATRVLTNELTEDNELQNTLELSNANIATSKGFDYISMKHDSEFGFIACTFNKGQRICLFQPAFDGIHGIPRSITCGIDSTFAIGNNNEWNGPISLFPESLIVHAGFLFVYNLGSDQVTKLCKLPPGTFYRIEVARDELGYCIGAIVFYYGDDPISANEYTEATASPRYILCTKRDEKEAWNVAEPAEGRSGCFLNSSGNHDRVLVVSASGATASLFSFAGQRGKDNQQARQSRGVQRFKMANRNIRSVFRTPFASWNAVLYHDSNSGQVAISSNTFNSNYGYDQMDDSNVVDQFLPDDATAMRLNDREIVLDVRWQRLPSRGRRSSYLGAIMTDKQIYFVRDVLEVISTFQFQRLQRVIVSHSLPSISWMGPTITMLFGNSLFSVTIDGNYDLIANISHGENVSCLVASLPDRIVYARHSRIHAQSSISIASRPVSEMSGIIRGMLVIIRANLIDREGHTHRIREVLNSHDASQGSLKLVEALTEGNLTGIAYLLAVCEQGQRSIPPLTRATFLGKIGDIRGALSIAESEYSKLSSDTGFHSGIELYRLLQRILNMAFASYDFAAGERCSKLLGRKGTFSAFIDCEGGYEAVKSLLDAAQNGNGPYPTEVIRPLLEKSSLSCTAVDSSNIPSQRKVDKMRRARATIDTNAIPLGSEDKCQMFIKVPLEDDEKASQEKNVQIVQVNAMSQTNIIDRLAKNWINNIHELSGIGTNDLMTFEELQENVGAIPIVDLEESQTQDDDFDDSSDDNDGSDSAPDSTYVSTRTSEKPSGPSSSSKPSQSSSSKPSTQSSASKPSTQSSASKPSTQSSSSKPSGSGTNTISGGEVTSEQEALSSSLAAGSSDITLPSDAADTNTLLSSQHNTGEAGAKIAKDKALYQSKRGLKRYDSERFSAAQKEFEFGLRAFERAAKKGIVSSDGSWAPILHELCYYTVACRVRTVLSEIGSSPHANTPDGRRTYALLATKLSRVPLQPRHVIDAILLGVNANMMVQNFGVASKGLKCLREREVGKDDEDLRNQLREKFAICQARGFTDAMHFPKGFVCWNTLKLIPIGAAFGCTICPAKYSRETLSAHQDMVCKTCKIGRLRVM